MLNFAVYPYKFGYLRINYENEKVLSFENMDENTLNDSKTEFTDKVFYQIKEYIKGKRKTFDFPYLLRGTEFQKKVWEELLKIPYGETKTYKEIANLIGNPNASRAVGKANNKNPLMILIPCHRVIGTDGKLTCYARGLEIKKYLLDLEKNNR